MATWIGAMTHSDRSIFIFFLPRPSVTFLHYNFEYLIFICKAAIRMLERCCVKAIESRERESALVESISPDNGIQSIEI